MRKILSILLSLVVLAGLTGAVFATDPPTIKIPVDTVIRSDEVGSRHLLASETVEEDLIGQVCAVAAIAKNQGSVHPGNNIEVASNGTMITLYDVERAPGVDTFANGTLKLGTDIDVTLVMGKDKVFSAGMVVTLDCEEEVIPEYECTSLTATVGSDKETYTFTTATKVSEDVTIEKYVYDFGIDGESAVTTDKSTITKVYSEPGTYNVNVDVHFTVIEEEKVDSCNTSITIEEEPEIPPETPQEPQVLPVTGPAAAIAGIFGASSLGYGAYSFKASRSSLRNKILGKD